MHLLLDTCIVYDWLNGNIRDAKAEAMILAEDSPVSPVTVWEMAIKHGIGKLPLPTTDVTGAIAAQGFVWIPVQPSHAQAKAEGMRVVT